MADHFYSQAAGRAGGEIVGWGIYKFVVDGSICEPGLLVRGIVDDNLIYGTWRGRDEEADPAATPPTPVGHEISHCLALLTITPEV